MARPTLRSQLEEQTAQLSALEQSHEELLKANEQIVSAYTLMEHRWEELQYIDLNNVTAAGDEVLPQAKRVETILRIRRLRQENPMAKQAIKLPLRFVLGKGVTYEIYDPNTKRIIDSFWNDPVNQAVWTSHFMQVQNFDELLTDGEDFLSLHAATAEAPYVRTAVVPMEEITQILYDPDNSRVPVWYVRRFRIRKWDPGLNNGQGGWAQEKNTDPIVRYYRDWRISDEYLADMEERTGFKIPDTKVGEGVIKHRMINPIKQRSGFRGISELFASREWFRVFKEFMEDRGAINAAANALAYERKVQGTPADVRAMTGKLGGLQVTPASDQPLSPSSFRRPLPGSMIDTNKSDIKSIRADTGAPGASQDAAMIRSTAGAGTGTPDHYFGATNAALAGAQAVEVAVVKAFEDFQTYLRNDMIETFTYVLSVARDTDITEARGDADEIALNFPPIMTQDIVKWVTAFAQWSQQVAPGNRAVRAKATRKVADVLGVSDIEQIWPDIEKEEARIAKEQDEAKQLARDAQQKALDAPAVAVVANGNGNNGPNKNPGGNSPVAPENGQKATTGPQEQGQSPQLSRVARGRPPNEGPTGPRSKRQ